MERREQGLSRRGLLGLAGAALIGGCGRAHDTPPVSMWAMSVQGENAPALLPRFEAMTGIPVALQAIPWTAAHEKLLTAYAGDTLPDVMMLSNGWTSEMVMLGALAPMPPTLRLTDDMLPDVLRSVRVGARDHALPWVVDTQVQFYRRDLLGEAGYAAPPPDWEGWLGMGRAYKRRNPDRFLALMLLDWPEHLFGYAAQQPEPLLRDRDTRGNFRSAGFRTALAHYKRIFDEGLAPRVVGTDVGDIFATFADGWVAVMPGGTDFVHDLRRRADRIAPARWSAAEMPGPDGPATGPVAGSSLAVAATARDPDRAWALVRYLCLPATQLRMRTLTGGLPSRPSTWTAPAVADDPVDTVFARQLARGRPAPLVPEWARIQTEVQIVAEHMVRGDYDVPGAAAEMDARVDRILAKRRWLLDHGRIA